MAPRIVVIWVLILQVFWIGAFSVANQYFKAPDMSGKKIAALEKKLHQSERLVAKLDVKFNEYRDSVAALGIKVDKETPWTDSKREIASVFADPQFKIAPHLDLIGNQIFDKGRKSFIEGDYQEASQRLEKFIQNYSYNSNLPQATYLLSESYIYLDAPESAVKTIDILITHYPESELSGYGMVRLGKLFEAQSRPEDAAEMFNIVIKQYPKSNAANLAKKNLKDLPL